MCLLTVLPSNSQELTYTATAGANGTPISLKKGPRAKLEHVDVFADGVASKQPGAKCFQQYADLHCTCRSQRHGYIPQKGPQSVKVVQVVPLLPFS